MQVPADLAREVEFESIKKIPPGRQGARVHDEYVVTFKEVEARDSIKSHASGLASAQGNAGLRLELPEYLKGSYRVLEEHGFAVKQLYGKDTKRNIRFDDRNRDLMIDIKLPNSIKRHNITIEQAMKTKKLREEAEVVKLAQGRSIA